jgi:hypothetical protein
MGSSENEGIHEVSIPDPLVALQGISWPKENNSTRRAFPKATFLHAPHVTVQRPRVNSSFSRSALSIHREGIDQLEQRAGSGPSERRHISPDGTDCAKLDSVANCRTRSLPELSAVNSDPLTYQQLVKAEKCGSSDHENPQAKYSDPGNCFLCWSVVGR